MNSYYPIEVLPLEDYKLQILFDNKEKRIFDVKPYLSDPFFAPIANSHIFKTVKTNSLTVEWLGEIDICPDELYWAYFVIVEKEYFMANQKLNTELR